MDWTTEHIAIGNYLDAQNAELLREHGFRSAISLDGTLRPNMAEGLGLMEIVTQVMEDGPGNNPRTFRRTVDALVDLAIYKSPVLVQCHAGRSRSPLLVAGYFVVVDEMEPPDALCRVGLKRQINLSEGLEPLLWDLLD